jgi:hypothetical protein
MFADTGQDFLHGCLQLARVTPKASPVLIITIVPNNGLQQAAMNDRAITVLFL